MQLDIILRGQSNAILLAELERGAAAGRLVQEVERLLGFDGVKDRVTLLHDRDGQGGDTMYSGTAFLGEWMARSQAGWAAGPLEQGFLARMGQYRAEGMGDATAILWMHSEYDSRDPNLLTADWTAAVRTDAALTRQALGRDAPYLFVAAHPYGDGTDAGHQAIRAGMEALDADPRFDAAIVARAPDTDIALDDLDGNPATTEYGFAHITAGDAMLIATRAARGVAEEWAAYAKPGSPVALARGDIASDGPMVVAASAAGPGQLQVDVRHDGTGGFLPLSAGAAKGLGWSLALPDGRRIEATGAAVLDADSLVVGFGQAVPAGAVLHYAWGIGRTAEPGGPGAGNAVLDSAALPAWTPAAGIAVGAPAMLPATPLPPRQGMAPPSPADALMRLTFGRDATAEEAGFLGWMEGRGVSRGDIARGLASGEAFGARTAGLDDAEFIALLHRDALGRGPAPAEQRLWQAEFAAGADRIDLVEALGDRIGSDLVFG